MGLYVYIRAFIEANEQSEQWSGQPNKIIFERKGKSDWKHKATVHRLEKIYKHFMRWTRLDTWK